MFEENIVEHYDVLLSLFGKNYLLESKFIHEKILEYSKDYKSLVDYGCGTGNHLLYFSSFYASLGLDYSEKMISIAIEKVKNAKFVHTSMRNLKIKDRFDIALCLFGSITYLENKTSINHTILNIKNQLNVGGLFIIEPWYTHEEIENRITQSQYGSYGAISGCRMYEISMVGNTAQMKDIILFNNGKKIKSLTAEHFLTILSYDEYGKILSKNGFSVELMENPITGRKIFFARKVS